MDTDWSITLLQKALDRWISVQNDIWLFLTTSPEDFRGGGIWATVETVATALVVVGVSLATLFFLIGVVKSTSTYIDLKRPEVAVKILLRLVITKIFIDNFMMIMLEIIAAVQALISFVAKKAAFTGAAAELIVPADLSSAIADAGFFEKLLVAIVGLIAFLAIFILSLLILFMVYLRFFKIYLYVALAPLPLATFAGESTQSHGVQFVRSFVGVCLQGLVIMLACIIFSAFSQGETAFVVDPEAHPVQALLEYSMSVITNMLILVILVKSVDTVTKEMFGL
jgi:hypothetical protein